MEKFFQTLLLLLLLCFADMAASAEGTQNEQPEMSMLAIASEHKNGHRHKHSGFSQAECPGACSYRCSKTQYHKACMFFCQKCCFKCRCVPPGTYGHKEVCACYNNWKTKSGGPKCP